MLLSREAQLALLHSGHPPRRNCFDRGLPLSWFSRCLGGSHLGERESSDLIRDGQTGNHFQRAESCSFQACFLQLERSLTCVTGRLLQIFWQEHVRSSLLQPVPSLQPPARAQSAAAEPSGVLTTPVGRIEKHLVDGPSWHSEGGDAVAATFSSAWSASWARCG